MTPALTICADMKGSCLIGLTQNSFISLFPEGISEEENKNMLGTTFRELPIIMQSMIYPSICSLTNLDV
jgi:hypothetical protein